MPDISTPLSDPSRVRAALLTANMPPVPPAPEAIGMDWLRASVARFCDGAEHRRRRELILDELQRISPAMLRERARQLAGQPYAHVRALAEALGLPEVSVRTVAVAATGYLPSVQTTMSAPGYQPSAAAGEAVDQAVAELVDACGGVADEATAARISILIQSCAATNALVERAHTAGAGLAEEALSEVLRSDPPVRYTHRLVDGNATPLDIAAAALPFGAGPHECPGRAHALALAAGILEGTR